MHDLKTMTLRRPSALRLRHRFFREPSLSIWMVSTVREDDERTECIATKAGGLVEDKGPIAVNPVSGRRIQTVDVINSLPELKER
jgi:hypothetical protein